MLPAVKGQELNVTLQGQSTLTTAKQFGDILLRVNQDGSRVYLRDVARVELAGEDLHVPGARERPPRRRGRHPPGSRRRQRAGHRRRRARQGQTTFPVLPRRRDVEFPYDSTEFISASIEEVVDDAGRGHRPGVSHHLFLPPKSPDGVHSHDRGAGGVAWHVRRDVCAGLFHQRADACSAWCWPSAFSWTTPSW